MKKHEWVHMVYSNCFECGHFDENGNNPLCLLTATEHDEFKEIETTNFEFPIWCPLEDYDENQS